MKSSMRKSCLRAYSKDGEALAAHVLLRGRDPQIGNGFSQPDHGMHLRLFYLTDTQHGMRYVPCD